MLPVFSLLPTDTEGHSLFFSCQCMLKAMIESNTDPPSWQHLKKTISADSVPFESSSACHHPWAPRCGTLLSIQPQPPLICDLSQTHTRPGKHSLSHTFYQMQEARSSTSASPHHQLKCPVQFQYLIIFVLVCVNYFHTFIYASYTVTYLRYPHWEINIG